MSAIERIMEIINNREIIQKELCDKTGIKQQTFSTWKNRNSSIPLDEAAAIADYLKVSLTYIATGKGTPDIIPLSGEEKELLRIFNTLGIKEKTSLLSHAYELESKNK